MNLRTRSVHRQQHEPEKTIDENLRSCTRTWPVTYTTKPIYLSAPRVETQGIGQSKRTDRYPTNATKLCRFSPNPGDNTADEHHPEPKDVLLKISFAAPREESVLEDLDGGKES